MSGLQGIVVTFKPTLKFCGSSVDKPGHRRWFQSKYPEVNKIVEQVLEINGIGASKTARKEMSEAIERILNLPLSPNEGD